MRSREFAETSIRRVGSGGEHVRAVGAASRRRARLAVDRSAVCARPWPGPPRPSSPGLAASSATRGRARLEHRAAQGGGAAAGARADEQLRRPAPVRCGAAGCSTRAGPRRVHGARRCAGCRCRRWRTARVRCLTSSSMPWEGRAEAEVAPDVQNPPTKPGELGGSRRVADRAVLSPIAIITAAALAADTHRLTTSPPHKESSMRFPMPMSSAAAVAARSVTGARARRGSRPPRGPRPRRRRVGGRRPSRLLRYAGSAGGAAANKAFFEAVIKSVAEKRAANPSGAAAVTVVYNASRAPTFATADSPQHAIWNSSVSNVKLQSGPRAPTSPTARATTRAARTPRRTATAAATSSSTTRRASSTTRPASPRTRPATCSVCPTTTPARAAS